MCQIAQMDGYGSTWQPKDHNFLLTLTATHAMLGYLVATHHFIPATLGRNHYYCWKMLKHPPEFFVISLAMSSRRANQKKWFFLFLYEKKMKQKATNTTKKEGFGKTMQFYWYLSIPLVSTPQSSHGTIYGVWKITIPLSPLSRERFGLGRWTNMVSRT